MRARVLMIDNYDSFTYNLVQALLVLGADVEVRSNDTVTVGEAMELAPTHLVVSPGPGRPEHAGITMTLIEAMTDVVPILGVCLGHQALAAVFGSVVAEARSLMHGKASQVHHDGMGLFQGLPSPFSAGRYHSLAVLEDGLSAELEVSAHTADGEIMGIRHRSLPLEGVQFHPESVLTPAGSRMLRNFLELQAGDATQPLPAVSA